MKFLKMFIGAVLSCLLLVAITAQAAIVEKDGDVATAIRGLQIGSVTYDVEFPTGSSAGIYGPFPGAFDFNSVEDGRTATEAVVLALNADGGVMAIGTSASDPRPIFRVPFGSVEISIDVLFVDLEVAFLHVWEGITGDTSSPGVWGIPEASDQFPYGDDGGFAIFTVVTTGGDGNSPPVADADGPYFGAVGAAVTFDGTSSTDLDGDIVSYAWSFGDGLTGSGISTTHIYSEASTFNVTLTVTDDSDMSASDSTEAVIGSSSQPPVADTGGPYNGSVGAAVTFDGSASTDEGGSIAAYAWDFGDSTSGTGISPNHIYAVAGTYNVVLTVTGDSEETDFDTTTATIGLGNRAPMAEAGGPYNGSVGTAVTFDGTGSGDLDGSIASYAWDFGDSTSGTGISASHIYTADGTYSVSLTVIDDLGATDSDGSQAVIGSSGNLPPDCTFAAPSITEIWPPNKRRFVPVGIEGVTDPDGNLTTISIDSVFQDEPVRLRIGDAIGLGRSIINLRAKRQLRGNGRVYHVFFTADDGLGGSCSGEVLVSVPRNRVKEAIDDGAKFDSTVPTTLPDSP